MAAEVQRWVIQRPERLRLFFLSGYSPELNPDEFLNKDVKSNAPGRRRPREATELIRSLRSYLRSTQRQPAIVRNYFLGLMDPPTRKFPIPHFATCHVNV